MAKAEGKAGKDAVTEAPPAEPNGTAAGRRAAEAKEKARRAAELAELAEQAAKEAAEAAAAVDADEPEVDDPAADEPEADEPDTAEADTDTAEIDSDDTDAADTDDADTDDTDTDEPDADATDVAKLDAEKADATGSDVTDTVEDELKTADPDAGEEAADEKAEGEAEDDETAVVSSSAKPSLVKTKESDSGEDEASDEADSAEDTKKASGGRGKARRRIRIPASGDGSRKIVVLSLVAVLGAVGVGWLFMKSQEMGATRTASKQAAYAATQAAQSISSYDYRTVDSDMRKATEYATGGFRKDFEAQAERVRTLAPQQQAMVTSTAVKTAVEDISPDSGTVLVFLNQQTVKASQTDKAGQPQRLPSQFTLRMSMTKVGDRWLASKVEVL
ncbi:hypothetical protein [Actinomadura sp. 9N407]|uniref:hypothetical protein n=1 Tax=Actinomadura sp. 9N407 TaxID=3375154 RepID=UPI0037948EE9